MLWLIGALMVLSILFGMVLTLVLLVYSSIGEDGIKIGNIVYWKEKEPPSKDEWKVM